MKSNPLNMFKPWFVLALAVAQVAASGAPQLLGWPSSIVERSLQNQSPAVPISFAFSIWGVIFAGSFAFAIFGLLPKNRQNKLWHAVAWFAALVFGLNTLWELYVPLYNLDWVAFAIIATAAATAITIVLRIASWPISLTQRERWCIAVPMQIFAGWLSAATFVGFPSTLLGAGVTLVDPRSNVVVIAVIIGATALASTVIMASRAIPYAITISWALLGVIIANVIRDNRPMIVVAAAIAMVIVIAVTVIALRRAGHLLHEKSATT